MVRLEFSFHLHALSIQVLDRLLLYLRIVHSVDYYINCDYPSEDEMPTRCGIMHVRGPIPPNRVSHREGKRTIQIVSHKSPQFGERQFLGKIAVSAVGAPPMHADGPPAGRADVALPLGARSV